MEIGHHGRRPRVVSMRRYPVKSMGGEPLAFVDIDGRGLSGDRWFAVADDDGHLASGKNTRRFRRRDAVFDYSASTSNGDVRVCSAGRDWLVGDPGLDQALSDAMRAGVHVRQESDAHHQDAGQVSLVGTASLHWCREHLGVDADARRLRVNLVVETATPFMEESWVGAQLCVGRSVLHVVEPIERCRMIDLAQDGVETTARWLKALGASRSLCIGVYADVVSPGRVRIGDELTRP